MIRSFWRAMKFKSASVMAVDIEHGSTGVEPGAASATNHYSPLILAALMMGPHMSNSDRSRAARSPGLEPTIVTPSASNLPLIAGSPRTAMVSAWILFTISGGVLPGANSAYHPETSKPGSPDSTNVGNSEAVAGRSADVTAS